MLLKFADRAIVETVKMPLAQNVNQQMDSYGYAAASVEREDHDRFLMAMFASRPARDSLMALYAFNVEVAKIRESISEVLIGRMKLQWWCDVIAAIYGNGRVPVGNPLVEALTGTIRSFDLSRAHFETLLDARAEDLNDAPPADVMDLERYAEGTSARLNWLALEILGVRDEASVAAARHVGIAWSLTGILRAVLFYAQTNRFLLPQDLMAAENLNPHDLQERGNALKISAVIARIAQNARAHIEKARTYRKSVDSRALPVLIGATLAEQYLSGLAGRRFDVFDPRHTLQRPNIVALTWNAILGRY